MNKIENYERKNEKTGMGEKIKGRKAEQRKREISSIFY